MPDGRPDDEDAVEAGLLAADVLGKAGNAAGAVEALRQVLALRPDHAPAHYGLAINLFRSGQDGEAASACRTALAIDPSNAIAHRVAGVVLGVHRFERGRALAHLRQAVALSPDDGFNHFYLARALAGRRRRKGALQSFALACRLAPDEPVILAGAAEYLFERRRTREATALAARALVAGPDHPMALAAMARSRLYAGRPGEAADLARASIAMVSTYEPAVEIVVEATMRRNPVFAVYLALRNWCRAGRMRGFALMISYAAVLGALLPNCGLPVAVWATLYYILLWGALIAKWVLGWTRGRRLRAALRPVRLRRRF